MTIEFSTDLQASNKLASAQAVENWVPFKRARPSFGPRVIGSIPALFSASKPESFSPF